MYPKIIVQPNYFPAWWCNNINNYMMQNVAASSDLGKKGVRKCDVRGLVPGMKPYKDVFDSLMMFAKNNINHLDVDIDYQIDGPCIQHITYMPGHGVGWHEDTMVKSAALRLERYKDLKVDRKVSLTVMLSSPDEYTGGEFIFGKADDHKHKVEGKGTVAMFTSHTEHMVTEITSGVRNILFIFITGPSWR